MPESVSSTRKFQPQMPRLSGGGPIIECRKFVPAIKGLRRTHDRSCVSDRIRDWRNGLVETKNNRRPEADCVTGRGSEFPYVATGLESRRIGHDSHRGGILGLESRGR